MRANFDQKRAEKHPLDIKNMRSIPFGKNLLFSEAQLDVWIHWAHVTEYVAMGLTHHGDKIGNSPNNAPLEYEIT